jgi:hypothetical protein
MTVHIDQVRHSSIVENADQDETEMGDWLGSLASLYRNAGADRVRFVL